MLLFQHISGYSVYLTHVTSKYVRSNKVVSGSVYVRVTLTRKMTFLSTKTKENYYGLQRKMANGQIVAQDK